MLGGARLLPVVLLCVTAACTGRTSPQFGSRTVRADAGVAGDAGVAQDAEVSDAGMIGVDVGVLDTGVVTPVDAGGLPLCDLDGPYRQRLAISDTAEPYYDGPAVVLSRDPLDLQLRSGEALRVDLGGIPLPSLAQPGQAVWLIYVVDDSVGTNRVVVLQDLTQNGEAGDLHLAAWQFDSEDPLDFQIGEVEIRYQGEACMPVDFDGCGPSQTQSMLVTLRNSVFLVESGQQVFTRGASFGNAETRLHTPSSQCDDVPMGHYESYIAID